jgi:mitogen-activated protein kinase 15
LTAEQALAHPYLSQFHNPGDEPTAPRTITVAIDDNQKFSLKDYREKLYEEISLKRK